MCFRFCGLRHIFIPFLANGQNQRIKDNAMFRRRSPDGSSFWALTLCRRAAVPPIASVPLVVDRMIHLLFSSMLAIVHGGKNHTGLDLLRYSSFNTDNVCQSASNVGFSRCLHSVLLGGSVLLWQRCHTLCTSGFVYTTEKKLHVVGIRTPIVHCQRATHAPPHPHRADHVTCRGTDTAAW